MCSEPGAGKRDKGARILGMGSGEEDMKTESNIPGRTAMYRNF